MEQGALQIEKKGKESWRFYKFHIFGQKRVLEKDFEAFVNDVYDKFEPTYDNSGGKLTIYGFFRLLRKSHTKSNQEYFDPRVTPDEFWLQP